MPLVRFVCHSYHAVYYILFGGVFASLLIVGSRFCCCSVVVVCVPLLLFQFWGCHCVCVRACMTPIESATLVTDQQSH